MVPAMRRTSIWPWRRRSRQNQRFCSSSLSGMNRPWVSGGRAEPGDRDGIGQARLAAVIAGSLNASGTKPRSISTTSPSGVVSGVMTCQPGVSVGYGKEIALLAVVEAAIDAHAQIAHIFAAPAHARRPLRGRWARPWCAPRSRRSGPLSIASRCNCQTPSPISTARAAA